MNLYDYSRLKLQNLYNSRNKSVGLLYFSWASCLWRKDMIILFDWGFFNYLFSVFQFIYEMRVRCKNLAVVFSLKCTWKSFSVSLSIFTVWVKQIQISNTLSWALGRFVLLGVSNVIFSRFCVLSSIVQGCKIINQRWKKRILV